MAALSFCALSRCDKLTPLKCELIDGDLIAGNRKGARNFGTLWTRTDPRALRLTDCLVLIYLRLGRLYRRLSGRRR